MKRIFTYILMATVLMTASCNRIEFPETDGAGDLSFVLRASDLETRSVPGDNNYNENTITSVDYFFFRDAEGTDIIKQGKVTTSTFSFNTNDAGNADLKNTFYAYFLVNYPGIDHSKTGEDAWTLEKLLALPVGPTDFEAESMPDFVMDSFDAGIASGTENGLLLMKPVQANEVRNETVNLSRVAVKLVLKINIAKSVAGNGSEVWTPEVDQLKAYFVNALTASTVAATPVQRTVTKPDDNDNYLTYSTDHPFDDAQSAETGTAIVRVTTPFYTYPQKFELNSNGEPYFKIQIPWTSTTRGTNPFYYKILVSNLKEYKRNSFYTVNLNLDVLGGTSEDYILATSDYYVAEWFTPGDMEQAGLSSARFLDIALDEYKFYNQDEMEIPVSSSHDIAIESITATKYDFYNKQTVTLAASKYSTSTNGKQSFTVTYELDNMMYTETTTNGTTTRSSNPNFDCSPITYTVKIKHSDGKQQRMEEVTIIQYPQVYIEQETSNGYCYVNNNGNAQSSSQDTYINNDFTGSFGSRNRMGADTGNNTNPRQYTIFVSVLPEGSTSVLGDPRGTASNLSANAIPATYRPTGTDTQSIIAPAFKFASSYGATDDLTFERAQKRCAGYQENGYPAGRWRVPTVAEIEFASQLSEYSHIPQLFNVYVSNNTVYGYWAGGKYSYGGTQYESRVGRLAESLSGINAANNSQTDSYYRKTVNGTTYSYYNAVRCVYDVWYWGEGQDSSHMTSWGSYQAD